jgi:hypothetical protein
MIRPSTPQPKPDLPHPGISMHRIRGFYSGRGDGWAAFMAIAAALIVGLIGLPHARWFLLGSILFGLIAVLAMRVWYRHKAAETKRMSILQ